ncbi:zf-DHHC-domain-containing protein [Fomitiporia mediterranea MF3/22]|uniref:zf-DHHC-domain-containing protein n=1 Tax=Fomitiporia mediterranea (strain MF3/22) TaxID=694068 RepID=UPI0004408677|nr:zf-DHHC-domain-containing protein [Fomitiporia mediterranea MF3/22]EJC98527.1 zf-DHHC-domain-containing protein [Fomitiporia mediterranea MF3/22]
MPLLTLQTSARAPYERLSDLPSASEDDDSVLDDGQEDGRPAKKKRWWMYLPLLMLVILLFAPQYNILVMLVSYYLTIHDSPFLFAVHLSIIYLFTFLASCSLLVCVVRDPGAIRVGEDAGPDSNMQDTEDENEETDMVDALRMSPNSKTRKGQPEPFDDDFNAPHKWCRKCWAPKPERTHHCSACGRCVLKMDHHCPWLAQKCVGHWTYTAFLHFLLCISLLSSYIALLAGRIVYVAFLNPFLVNERTALHALFLSIYGAIFSLVVGSFFLWHVYLASTNQTTIENISPFLLLRYLPSSPAIHTLPEASTPLATAGSIPPFPPQPSLHPSSRPSTPPDPTYASLHVPTTPTSQAQLRLHEHQLNASQRRHVRYAHSQIRLYDVGFRANWAQIIGVGKKRGWRGVVYKLICGGGGAGNGKTFPRNPRAEGMLARLAAELASEDKID